MTARLEGGSHRRSARCAVASSSCTHSRVEKLAADPFQKFRQRKRGGGGMRLTILTGAIILACIGASFADDDPIKARQKLMDANGDTSKPLVPVLKGQAPFDLATAQTALKAYIATAEK